MNANAVLVTAGAVTTVSIVALLIYAVAKSPNQTVHNVSVTQPPAPQQQSLVLGGSPQIAQGGGNVAVANQFIQRFGGATVQALRQLNQPLLTIAQKTITAVGPIPQGYDKLF